MTGSIDREREGGLVILRGITFSKNFRHEVGSHLFSNLKYMNQCKRKYILKSIILFIFYHHSFTVFIYNFAVGNWAGDWAS